MKKKISTIIYYLSFEELREVVRTNKLDYQVISKRKDEYGYFPPPTSKGSACLRGRHRSPQQRDARPLTLMNRSE
jgi:hypothetical protein